MNLKAPAATTPISSFDDLPLSDPMRAALALAGYTQPTPVQAGLIPLALQGLDLVGQAQTGTGKTAAFAIPILERLQPRKESRGPQALIMTPTRELAVQVADSVKAYGRHVPLRSSVVYGGVPMGRPWDVKSDAADWLRSTPGPGVAS